MKTYIYEAEAIKYSAFMGRAKEDYLEVITRRGEQGWRFVSFVPPQAKTKGVKGTELIFEKEFDSLSD